MLYATGTSTGPALKYNGENIIVGRSSWVPIGAEQVAGGYEVAWKLTGADPYTVWNTDSSGNYISSPVSIVAGSSRTLQSLEASFHQDLNGDGVIGIPNIVIEATGFHHSLTAVGNSYLLYATGTTTGPALKYNGANIIVGQSSWVPIGAEQVAGGYEVAWKLTGADAYTVWYTNSGGNYVSNAIDSVSGSNSTLDRSKPAFIKTLMAMV